MLENKYKLGQTVYGVYVPNTEYDTGIIGIKKGSVNSIKLEGESIVYTLDHISATSIMGYSHDAKDYRNTFDEKDVFPNKEEALSRVHEILEDYDYMHVKFLHDIEEAFKHDVLLKYNRHNLINKLKSRLKAFTIENPPLTLISFLGFNDCWVSGQDITCKTSDDGIKFKLIDPTGKMIKEYELDYPDIPTYILQILYSDGV